MNLPDSLRVGIATAVFAAALGVAGCAPHVTPPGSADGATLATPPNSARTALATLPVKGRAPMTGYSRAQFGPAWADVDGNGCDTRDDILARDLTAVTRQGHCTVTRGQLSDPYTGRAIAFVRGPQSAAVQIDHVVALGDAWQTGAQQLTPARREQLANDPANLLAVDGPTNQAKGDGDSATWLPRPTERCDYVARQIGVKAKYGLWVTPAERDADARVLATCPGQTVPHPTAVSRG